LPGAAVAVINKSIGLNDTLSPSKLRLIAPVCSVRIEQVPEILVIGKVTGKLVTVPMTLPVVPVNVPEIVPTALMTPFTSVKLVVVSVPVNVPTPGMTCRMAVLNEPEGGGGAADMGIGAVTSTVENKANIKAIHIATFFWLCIRFPPLCSARGRPGEQLAANQIKAEKNPLVCGHLAV